MLDCTANVRFNQGNLRQHTVLQMARKDAEGTGGPMPYCARPGTLLIAGNQPAHVDWRTRTAVLEPQAQQRRDFLTKLLDFFFHDVSWGGRYRLGSSDIDACAAVDHSYTDLVNAVRRNDDDTRIGALLALLFAHANPRTDRAVSTCRHDHVPRPASDAAQGLAALGGLLVCAAT